MYSDHLDLTTFNALLKTKEIGKSTQPNEVWNEIDSTNSRASELAKSGSAHGVVIAARQQTAGRGRQGRTWTSPKDAGLYISFLLRPHIPLTQIPLISLATGSAVARAVQDVAGIDVGLKWVNDIILEGKKLGGILAEMPDGKSLVIGIGINVKSVERPKEIADKAISIEEVSRRPTDINQLAAELAREIEVSYSLLCKGERTLIIDEWKRRSITLGKTIRAYLKDEEIEGVANDIDADGALLVQTKSGEHRLHAGEISIRNVDGSYA